MDVSFTKISGQELLNNTDMICERVPMSLGHRGCIHWLARANRLPIIRRSSNRDQVSFFILTYRFSMKIWFYNDGH